MKKVISIICITLLVALYSCDERDDLRSDIDNLKERVANLEASIEQMNSDISNYQQMVEGKILVVGYSKDEQDNYTIELSNGETVTIYSGKVDMNDMPLFSVNASGHWAYTINDITVTRNTSEMKRCFNLIRYRAGLPGITDADVANVERMRELIARERQIEFAWEGRRYHDLRRTKKAIIYENAPVMGCDVSATEAEKDKFYNIIQVKERDWIYKVFTRRQTFFPIPKSEVDKNPNLDQMPGF